MMFEGVDTTRILPCPFCGGEGLPQQIVADNGEDRFFLRCRSCACEGPWGKTASSAIRWWNMRTPHSANPDTLKRDGKTA